MDIYASGFDVSFSVDVVDNDGMAISDATAITMKIYDQEGAQVGSDESVSTSLIVSGVLSITTLAAANTISGIATRDARLIKLYVTTASGGTIVFTHIYAIRTEDVIVVMNNSYQTYQGAEITALDIPNLDEWNEATQDEKNQSLIESFSRIGKINFEVNGVLIADINSLTEAEFLALSLGFIIAVKRAQLIEANAALGNNVISEKRESGLMSETVGESSNMYRPGKPVLLSTSRKALNALTGYVKYGASVGRA